VAAQRRGQTRGIARIAATCCQPFARAGELFRCANERRYLVTARERLLDKLPAGATCRAEDEQTDRADLSFRSQAKVTRSARPPCR
jgi:hypothetical protein